MINQKIWRWEQCEGGYKIEERYVVIWNILFGYFVLQILWEFLMLFLSDRFLREVKNFKWKLDDFILYYIYIVSVIGMYVFVDIVGMKLKGKLMKEFYKSND